ncbi:6-phosphogluconolactonase [Mesobaculum littorinae]|uniref:6-phosphogluconolactonase n=1 Tax=Mesobaculum littorinae TaxID=2486419 RepID=A0A438AL29_9RHOB|nr:6-phosphogluconolactonase [Mesobaculum littorinae]RVV99379.1 6-phosphogluconolactonase [Mesobaculum littorinae]
MELIEYPDREMMMIDLADKLASELNRWLMANDRATFVVPGGTTPGPIFDTISGINIAWDRVDVMLSDDRWVPEDHPRSNTRLLRKRLLRDRAEAAHYVPLHCDTETPEEGIDRVGAAVSGHLPISLLLLGMGGDMHTASLFPGADRLADALADDAPPLMAMRGGGANEPRITLTAPVLRDAMSTHIVITGPEKRAALEKARGLKPAEAPVSVVLRDATVHWAE